jgi:hypothetical protein
VASSSSTLAASVEASSISMALETSSSTSAVAQSQVATDAPVPTPVPGTTAAGAEEQVTGLPFDINTLSLQSRVTVDLGRRLVQPTEVKRGWW